MKRQKKTPPLVFRLDDAELRDAVVAYLDGLEALHGQRLTVQELITRALKRYLRVK